VFDRWLPHVTAGVAYGTRNANGTVTGYRAAPTTPATPASAGRRGWCHYAFTDRWIARLEYLHLSLAGFSPTYALTAGNLTVAYGRLTIDIIRGGFNYRLMPW
jgi:hypothetical protein